MENETEEVKEEEEGEVAVLLCNAPAPLVVNGGIYMGCQCGKGHEGNHEARISWPR